MRRAAARAALAALLLCPGAIAQEPSASPAASASDAALTEAARDLARRLEPLMDDAFERPPVVARAPELILDAATDFRAVRMLDAERLAARGRAWAALGLGDPGTPADVYRWIARDLRGCAVDEERGRLLLAADVLADTGPRIGGGEDADLLMAAGILPDEPLLAHCLMHLRQRERRGAPLRAETTDGLLAAAGWMEAEASLVALRFLFSALGLGDEMLRADLDPGDFLDGSLLPRGLGRLDGVRAGFVRFVYEDAFARAARIFAADGWQGVDRAMRRTTTTRGVLHPDRAGRAPAAFAEPRAPVPDAGLVAVDTDSLGELGTILWVSLLTGKDSLGLETGDGWAGDRLTRWEVPGAPADGVTVWETAWAGDDAVADWLYAVERALTERFPRETVRLRSEGWKSIAGVDALYVWGRDGDRATLLVGPAALLTPVLPRPTHPPRTVFTKDAPQPPAQRK